MSIASHLHQLLNAETCQSYIHALRWKEQTCKRTFNDLTGTLLDGSKRSVRHWMLATFLLCLSCSSVGLPRSWGSMSVPATAGAGAGGAMPPYLMR